MFSLETTKEKVLFKIKDAFTDPENTFDKTNKLKDLYRTVKAAEDLTPELMSRVAFLTRK
jgi:uncharacterized protein YfkK (UPF0435 family)